MKSPLIVIPARMQASRLPGKPLADIAGKPMILHVLDRAQEADIGRVAVATDADEIAQVVVDAGGEAVMTSPDHPSGSDRVYEAVNKLDPDAQHGIVINLQGDLPSLDPGLLQRCHEVAASTKTDIATLAAEIVDPAERDDPNCVKVVGSQLTDDAALLRALYFTRATAPYGDGPLYHHIGIYAYQRAALSRFVALPASPLEQREKLEQLRALEAGMTIHVAIVDTVPVGVDTPADLEQARKRLGNA